MELISSILIGLGLSVACGFKVFLPLLGMSIFAQAGQLKLAAEFDWIASYPALAAFMAAAVFESAEYYSPWVSDLFNKIAVPLSTAAGVIVTASSVVEINPFLRWALAIIAGTGVSGTVKARLVKVRQAGVSSVGNFGLLLTSSELIISFLLTILLIIVVLEPYLLLVLGLCFFIFYIIIWKLKSLSK